MTTECSFGCRLNLPFKRLVDTFLQSHDDLLLKGAVRGNVTVQGSKFKGVCVAVDAALHTFSRARARAKGERTFLFLAGSSY